MLNKTKYLKIALTNELKQTYLLLKFQSIAQMQWLSEQLNLKSKQLKASKSKSRSTKLKKQIEDFEYTKKIVNDEIQACVLNIDMLDSKLNILQKG